VTGKLIKVTFALAVIIIELICVDRFILQYKCIYVVFVILDNPIQGPD